MTRHGPSTPTDSPIATTSVAATSARALGALFWPIVTAAVLAIVLVIVKVDLAPQVSPDFFFSTDDPALAANQAIEADFPAAEQLYFAVKVESPLADENLARVRAFSDALAAVPGVSTVVSLTHVPAAPATITTSPLWSRLLLAEDDPNLTNLIVNLARPAASDDESPGAFEVVESIEAVVAAHDAPSFDIAMSGGPHVVELVRRALKRDLRRFSLASALVFGLLVALVYRSLPIVLGTLVSAAAAAILTLAANHLLGTAIGVLTANIVTIVFVLTLSHIVFLTANRQRVEPTADSGAGSGTDETTAAVARTLPASLWAAATTLLGFLSLRLASAQPLRELAIAGATATVMAFLAAFVLYPRFLARARRLGTPRPATSTGGARPIRWWPAVAVLGLAAVVGFGVRQLETDPSLLAFFDEDGEIHRGIERIDNTGGSSPLVLIVRDPADADDESTMLDEASDARLRAFQAALDADPAVGVALSLPLLIDEARRVPLARFIPRPQLVDLLASDRFDRIAESFVDDARQRALVLLRMRESGRDQPRTAIIDRIETAARDAGLAIETTGGIYQLQSALGDLVRSSLVRGLAGLFVLFLVVAFLVARAAQPAAAMVVALLVVPALLLGAMGWLGWPVDFISSPAANIALALGIDGMIHLVSAYRRARGAGASVSDGWQQARAAIGPAILGAMAILAGGFGIFALSSFPPTARFGLAVALGTLAAAASALLVLPALGGGSRRHAR